MYITYTQKPYFVPSCYKEVLHKGGIPYSNDSDRGVVATNNWAEEVVYLHHENKLSFDHAVMILRKLKSDPERQAELLSTLCLGGGSAVLLYVTELLRKPKL